MFDRRNGNQPRRGWSIVLNGVSIAQAVLLCACAAFKPAPTDGREAWRKVDTTALACKPFETIVVENAFVVTGPEVAGLVQYTQGETSVGINDVEVAIRPLGGGKVVHTVKTTTSGKFVLPPVADGWYQIETCRDGWNTAVMPIKVARTSSGASVALNISIAH